MANTPCGTIRELRREIAKSINTTAEEIYREIVRTTPKRSGAAARAWTPPKKIQDEAFDGIITTNALPYVPRLEEGWSKQAPNGFIQQSIDKITRKGK
jgi:hypothetical protein